MLISWTKILSTLYWGRTHFIIYNVLLSPIRFVLTCYNRKSMLAVIVFKKYRRARNTGHVPQTQTFRLKLFCFDRQSWSFLTKISCFTIYLEYRKDIDCGNIMYTQTLTTHLIIHIFSVLYAIHAVGYPLHIWSV